MNWKFWKRAKPPFWKNHPNDPIYMALSALSQDEAMRIVHQLARVHYMEVVTHPGVRRWISENAGYVAWACKNGKFPTMEGK